MHNEGMPVSKNTCAMTALKGFVLSLTTSEMKFHVSYTRKP